MVVFREIVSVLNLTESSVSFYACYYVEFNTTLLYFHGFF